MHTRHPGPPLERPNPLQWLRYAFGGRLPQRLAPWVLADTTDPGWVARHLARAVVQMLPVVLLCLLVPLPWSYRVTMAVGGLLVGVIFSLALIVETTEHRVTKAGFVHGTASALREERREREQSERHSQYRVDGSGSFD